VEFVASLHGDILSLCLKATSNTLECEGRKRGRIWKDEVLDKRFRDIIAEEGIKRINRLPEQRKVVENRNL
jgi:hypothetical protein